MAHVILDNASVEFPIFGEEDFSIRRRIVNLFIKEKEISHNNIISALKNVSLNLQDGIKLGLVGLNGAGKTTLLKLLAKIYTATNGKVEISGSCSTLFDLSLGMDEEASGHENIFISGCMLGLSRHQIRSRIPEIIEFTELGDVLQRPLRTFSTGMRVRLAFAIATGLDSDIMLIDEIIGVGDAKFLSKASRRIKDNMDKSKIVVVASHAEFVLRDFCDTGLLIHRGKILQFGPIEDVIQEYNTNIVSKR